MLTRSDLRHTCFRMKQGAAPSKGNEELVDLLIPLIPKNESWDSFSVKWDIYVDKDNVIHVIKPETDYDFIHTTCIEAAIMKRKNMDFSFNTRQANIVEIVELNMMENMRWEDYNVKWGVIVDYELKKINTRWFKTIQNVVTPEMIAASAVSDGTAMTELPTLPAVQLEMEPSSELSESEQALISAALKKKNR